MATLNQQLDYRNHEGRIGMIITWSRIFKKLSRRFVGTHFKCLKWKYRRRMARRGLQTTTLDVANTISCCIYHVTSVFNIRWPSMGLRQLLPLLAQEITGNGQLSDCHQPPVQNAQKTRKARAEAFRQWLNHDWRSFTWNDSWGYQWSCKV